MKEIVVVGFKYTSNKPDILTKGKITLQKEPNNKYNSDAVKVLVDNKHVGYVANEYIKNIDYTKTYQVFEIYNASVKMFPLE